MSDSAESIATDGSVSMMCLRNTHSITVSYTQVVDLLIAMANAAANSSRVQIILDPYPSIVDPLKRSELAMDPKVHVTQQYLCYDLGCVFYTGKGL